MEKSKKSAITYPNHKIKVFFALSLFLLGCAASSLFLVGTVNAIALSVS